MDNAAPLWIFFLMVLGIVALPGMDMAFIVGSALHGGRRRGLLAVAGVMAGAVFHILVTGLGISVVLNWWPALFNALLVGGAAYLVWIGFNLVRMDASNGLPQALVGTRSEAATFRQALLTNVLNPKAYVFTLAVLPQFLRSGDRPMWLQFVVLGLIIWAVQAGVYGPLALAAGSARQGLASRPGARLFLARATGVVLIAGALLTAVQGWRA
ncbi:MAG TPA: LysE family translocator [Ramlibacter sp.]|nr:LysE family translocator [Ramlibacter sp.]